MLNVLREETEINVFKLSYLVEQNLEFELK